jgi:hypothetical protein
MVRRGGVCEWKGPVCTGVAHGMDRRMRPDVSLIIVNHQSAPDVRALMRSLAEHPQACELEAVVVNTGPVRAWEPEGEEIVPATAITLDRNVGYGAAVNRGLEEASGRYLLAVNADLLFRDSCLETAVEYMQRHPEVGVLAPRLVFPDGTLQYSGRRFYTVRTLLSRRTPLRRLLQRTEEEHLYATEDHDRVFPVDWAIGAALMIRRELIDGGRLFDERYFLYLEDVDLCAAAWHRGFAVVYFPPVTLEHRHTRMSANRLWGRATRTHARSLWRFWRKWGTLQPSGSAQAEGGGDRAG